MNARITSIVFASVLTLSGAASASTTSSTSSTSSTASTAAPADTVTASASPETNKATDVQWIGHAGATGGKGYAGALLGTSLLLRNDWLIGGVTFEASGAYATRFGLAATGGLALRSDDGWRGELLGVVGVHRYDGVGRSMLGNDPGAGATLPFAGARARGAYEFGSGTRRFQLGISGALERDLSTATRTYSYSATSLFSNESRPAEASHSIGFTTTSVMIDAGVSFL